MKKTGLQIENDVYQLIRQGKLVSLIRGKLYKEGFRPINSKDEDAVITFIAGLDAQVQSGALNLNIYVPNTNNNSKTLVKDIDRCMEIEIAANDFVQNIISDEYVFSLRGIIKTYQAEGIEQHFVNVKLKFRRITI